MRTRKWKAALVAIGSIAGLLATALPAHGATTEQDRLQEALDKVVQAGAPGAFARVVDGEQTWQSASGHADVLTHRPMDPASNTRIGSITKSSVSVGILRLVEDGKLTLDDSLQSQLGDVLGSRYAEDKITVRDLLRHTSGIYNYTADPLMLPRGCVLPVSDEDSVGIAAGQDPSFAPGESWEYSNTNYVLLGMIIKKITGSEVPDYLSEAVWEPAGMEDVVWPRDRTLPDPHPRGYFVTPPFDVTNCDPTWASSAGIMVTDADDLTDFWHAVFDGDLLEPSSLAAMTDTVPMGEADAGYGLGVGEVTTSCGTAWGHSGAVPGYSTYTYYDRSTGRQVAIGINVFGSSRPGAALNELLELALCGEDAGVRADVTTLEEEQVPATRR